MIWKTNKFNEDLAEAVAEFNRDRATELCEDLVHHLRERDEPYPAEHSKTVLDQLRGKRYFDLMQSVADALIQNQQTDAKVRRQYAQSQLDQGNLTAAISTLNNLETDTAPNGIDPNKEEYAEARGLLGRAYKDLYMLADKPSRSRNRRFIEKAIEYYRSIYSNDKGKIWQGINSVALIQRADSDGVELETIADPKRLADLMAREILSEVKKRHLKKRADTWDFATAVEACIGLDMHEDALIWLRRYLKSDYTNAFELGSTYRQLTQVWKLHPGKAPGDKILPALKAALLEERGSEIEIGVKDAAREKLDELAEDAGYEKVLGKEAFRSLKWFRMCMQRASAVAKVEDSLGDAVGTAFVVRGGDLKAELGDELLLLTNAHVISEDPLVSRALRPDKAVLNFELRKNNNPAEFEVEQVWSSKPEDLDATLLRPTQPIENVEPMPLTDIRPLADGQQRAYIIGHPQGRKLSFSIHDNYLLDYDDRLLHYRSPTEPGNSGSPVFNDEWELIGLHHRGLRKMPRLNNQEGTYPANEGIWIQAIINRLKDAELG
jgi:tetratricopeptide (TPR) repeat protein